MALTFATAVLIFVNIWLLALTAFATGASAVFLHILGAVDDVIGASVAISLICSALSFTYLVLQSLNVSRVKQRRWSHSWLSRICVLLPRVLIVTWIVTTTAGLVVALRQPLCQSGDVKQDAAEWQSGLGCWMFRVLVSLNVVMLVLSFCIFILLEINGRYICIGLFHFEYSSSDTNPHRRTLANSSYGESQVSLASPVTITSEDEQNLASEKQQTRTIISPSPTYRTIDNRRVRAQRSLSALDEESLLDLTASRRTTCTTTALAALPLSQIPATAVPTTTPSTSAPPPAILASSQLSARPVSNIPALPLSFQNQIKELERMKAEHEAAAAAIVAVQTPIRATKTPNANLHNVTLTSASLNNLNLKSSSALPLANPSPTLPPNNIETANQERCISTDCAVQAPEWYPNPLKHDPLDSDPAIKRLTGLRRASVHVGPRVSRRLSFSGFEFGFGSRRTTTSKMQCGEDGAISTDAAVVHDSDNGQDGCGGGLDTLSDSDRKENVVPPPVVAIRQGGDVREEKRKSTATSVKSRAGPKRSIFPPPVPAPRPPTMTATGMGVDRASSRAGGISGAATSRKRGKSMVERGRYEKLPR